MLDSRSEPCGDAVVSTGAGAITSDHRGPAAADYAVAGVGRTFEGLLQEGTVRDYADLARLGGVSRARITQIMSLRGRVSRTWGRRSIVRGRCGC
jgi:predicted flap endonuclease-1-like 5' DNA nuclease